MTFEGKTVLVTGATGFLGGALALRLAAAGAHVRALARSPQKGAFLAAQPGIEIAAGDITDPGGLGAIVRGCEIVFHSAAALGGSLDVQRPVNAGGTRCLLDAAAQAGVTRFVHISSIAVYGYRLRGRQVIREDTPPGPSEDPYVITKREAEAAVCEAVQRGLSAAIVRPGAIYGPRSNFWTRKLFLYARRRPLVLVGRGRGGIPAIFIDDVVDLCLIAALHPAAHGEAFNATPDPSPTLREYLGGLARLAGNGHWLGLPAGMVRGAAYLAARRAPPDSQRREWPGLLDLVTRPVTYSNAKAGQQLGWQPQVGLADGLARSAEWLRAMGTLDG